MWGVHRLAMHIFFIHNSHRALAIYQQWKRKAKLAIYHDVDKRLPLHNQILSLNNNKKTKRTWTTRHRADVTCIIGLIALGITCKCKAPFEPRCIGWLHDGAPNNVVVVADDALDSRLLYDVNGLHHINVCACI